MNRALLALALVACAAVAVSAVQYKNTDMALTESFVNSINAAQKDWTASTQQGAFFEDINMKSAKQLMGVRWGPKILPRKTFDARVSLPASFDSSVNWPSCVTIMQIRDQSACGSCWAFGGAEAMSDRYCTVLGSTNSKYDDIEISAGNLMSCCASCGDGCNGGFPEAAWQYWQETGLPTRQCDPYPFPKCEHHISGGQYPPCPKNEYPTPQCNTTCSDGSVPTLYYGSSAYSLSGEQDIMQEIMTNGPIEVAFTVYSDFLTYKSGVYRHITGSVLGGHAVKMIGWGVTPAGVKYWIVNNSWNQDWGNKGQFWILRGVDECGIEDSGAAGMPATF
jgi:cysteine peptidase C